MKAHKDDAGVVSTFCIPQNVIYTDLTALPFVSRRFTENGTAKKVGTAQECSVRKHVVTSIKGSSRSLGFF